MKKPVLGSITFLYGQPDALMALQLDKIVIISFL